MQSARTAAGSRGGALPGTVGGDLARDIMVAIGALDGVVAHRNNVGAATYAGGARVRYGVGGTGAPDLLVEVRDPWGRYLCVWLECKAGEGELTTVQRAWHKAAKKMGRHAYVVRNVEHARAIIESFKLGDVVSYG